MCTEASSPEPLIGITAAVAAAAPAAPAAGINLSLPSFPGVIPDILECLVSVIYILWSP